MSIRTRLVSCVAAGAVVAGGLAFAPEAARADTAPTTTATYNCVGTGSLGSVSIPLTLTVQSLTDGLTAGTPLQPVLHTAVGQIGSVVTQLLSVVDSVLNAVLGPILDFLNQVFGTALPTTTFTAQIADLELQLVNGAGTAVSSLGTTLRSQLSLADLSALGQNNPLALALQPLTGGLSAATGGTYSLTAPASFNLSFLGDTVSNLGCTVSTVGGSVATVVNNRIVLDSSVVVKTPTKPSTGTGSGTTGPAATANPCTAPLPKVGTKKTTLKLSLAAKKIKASKKGTLRVKSTYKVKKGKRKVAKKVKGSILVCDGKKVLGYASVKGNTKLKLPKLAVGKHRLLVRFLPAGTKAKPASKRILLTVKR